MDGSVECRDYTAGRRYPITISRIGEGKYTLAFPWGRQEVSVYLVAVPLFALAVLSVPVWWQLVVAVTGGGFAAAAVGLAILVGIPVLAGMAVSASGVKTRDLPGLAVALVAMRPRARAGVSSVGPVAPEPRVHARPRAWVTGR